MILYTCYHLLGDYIGQGGEFTVEKTVEQVLKTGADFGNASDAVRFGIVLVVLLVVLGWVFYDREKKQKATVDDLLARLAKCDADKELLDKKIDAERENHKKELTTIRTIILARIEAFNLNDEDRRATIGDLVLHVQAAFDLLRRVATAVDPSLTVGNPRPIRRVRKQNELVDEEISDS